MLLVVALVTKKKQEKGICLHSCNFLIKLKHKIKFLRYTLKRLIVGKMKNSTFVDLNACY